MDLESATDHVAMVTGDTARTVDFYTRVMGWPLVGAQRGKEADGRGYFITAFRADQWVLEFEEVEGRPGPRPQAPGFPHIGLDVGSRDEYERWKSHLQSSGVDYLEVTEHDCFFTDPNGLSFQLVVKDGPPTPVAERAALAHELVQQWVTRQRPG